MIANRLIPQTEGGMVVNNMMDDETMTNPPGEGKRPSVTPTVQAEKPDDSSRKGAESQRARQVVNKSTLISLSEPNYSEEKGQLVGNDHLNRPFMCKQAIQVWLVQVEPEV